VRIFDALNRQHSDSIAYNRAIGADDDKNRGTAGVKELPSGALHQRHAVHREQLFG
jgi:hypothetical protein